MLDKEGSVGSNWERRRMVMNWIYSRMVRFGHAKMGEIGDSRQPLGICLQVQVMGFCTGVLYTQSSNYPVRSKT